jgi:hypothetical protein
MLLAGLCTNTKAEAQTYTGDFEATLSYGMYSGTEVFSMKYAYGLYDEGGYRYGEYTQTAHTGNLFGSFKVHLTNRTAVGLTLGVQSLSYSYINNGPSYYFNNFATKATITTLAIEIKRIYSNANHKYFQFYGLGCIGARYMYENQTPGQEYNMLPRFFINSQISPLCVRYGGNLGGFLELGFGCKGIINGGISYKYWGRNSLNHGYIDPSVEQKQL